MSRIASVEAQFENLWPEVGSRSQSQCQAQLCVDSRDSPARVRTPCSVWPGGSLTAVSRHLLLLGQHRASVLFSCQVRGKKKTLIFLASNRQQEISRCNQFSLARNFFCTLLYHLNSSGNTESIGINMIFVPSSLHFLYRYNTQKLQNHHFL